MRVNIVGSGVSSLFALLAKVTAQWPLTFILIPLGITTLLTSLLLLTTELEIKHDIEYLFTPFHGRSKLDRAAVEKVFPPGKGPFDPGRLTRFVKFGRTILESVDGTSFFRPDLFQVAVCVDQVIQGISVKVNGTEYSYADLCAKSIERKCLPNVVLNLKDNIDKVYNGTLKVHYPVEKDPVTHSVKYYGNSLGGVSLDDDGNVVFVRAIALSYYLDPYTPSLQEPIKKWEQAFLSTLEGLAFENVEVYRYASVTFEEALTNDAKKAPFYFSFSITILLIFCVITCLMQDWVQSKPLFGLLGCLSSTLAVVAALAICSLAGLEFIGINMVIPFIMLGIGIDDTFVILAAWRRTDRKKALSERMSETYRHAGVSITVTSLTNMTSFLVGSTTPFQAAQIFCTYTAVAVLFVYLYQITFFGGCFVYCARAEQRNLHAVTCRPALPRSLAVHHGKLYRIFCTGGLDPNNPDHPADNLPHQGMVFFRDSVGSWLARPWAKVAILAGFGIYLAVGIYGCTQMKEGLELYHLFGYDSYATNFTLKESEYLDQYFIRVQVVIDEPLNYADPRVQGQVEALLQKMEALKYVADSSLSESWLRNFNRFVNDPRSQLWVSGFNLTRKEDFIQCVRYVFLKFPPAARFRNDLVFSSDGKDIVASRFFIHSNGTQNSIGLRDLMVDAQRLADSQPFSAHVYNPFFVLMDMYVVVWDLTIQAICVTAVVMLAITLLFIPDFTCALWVAFSIASIELGVMGYLSLWGVNLNSTTLVCLIMCVGFSVDNAAHIAYAYVSSSRGGEKDPNRRMQEALYYVGLPIFQACGSTLIGVIPLYFAPSYNFMVLCKTITLVMLFAGLHSIFLLPVLLTIFGALRYSGQKKPPTGQREVMEAGGELFEKELMLRTKIENINNNNVIKIVK